MSRRPLSRRIGLFLAAFGLVLMTAGIFRGEAGVVMEKAINLCMECIGIG